MLILSKATYRFHAILIKTCSFIIFFYRNRKIYPKFIWNLKDPQIATKKKKLKKNKVGGVTLPNFKIYFKALVIKTV